MSKKISTKDVNVGGGLQKVIEPGEHVLKINGVKLTRYNFMESDEGYFLVFDVETKPIPDFEGFFIDKDDESKGRYAGQIGQIKTNAFYYHDTTTKAGVPIKRDLEILRQIKTLCSTIGADDWFDKADGKYDTIEAFVEAFDKDAPFKNIFMKFCVAGKEYNRDNGYIGYDLSFPRYEKGKVFHELENVKVSKLITFDQEKHIRKASPKEVTEFGQTDADALSEIPIHNNDLSGAPDFDL